MMDCLRRGTATIGEYQRDYVATPVMRKQLATQYVLMRDDWVS